MIQPRNGYNQYYFALDSIFFEAKLTSCARGDTICLRPLQVDNIFVFIRQVALLFRHNNIFVCIRQVAPFRHVGYLRHQQLVDL